MIIPVQATVPIPILQRGWKRLRAVDFLRKKRRLAFDRPSGPSYKLKAASGTCSLEDGRCEVVSRPCARKGRQPSLNVCQPNKRTQSRFKNQCGERRPENVLACLEPGSCELKIATSLSRKDRELPTGSELSRWTAS